MLKFILFYYSITEFMIVLRIIGFVSHESYTFTPVCHLLYLPCDLLWGFIFLFFYHFKFVY